MRPATPVRPPSPATRRGRSDARTARHPQPPTAAVPCATTGAAAPSGSRAADADATAVPSDGSRRRARAGDRRGRTVARTSTVGLPCAALSYPRTRRATAVDRDSDRAAEAPTTTVGRSDLRRRASAGAVALRAARRDGVRRHRCAAEHPRATGRGGQAGREHVVRAVLVERGYGRPHHARACHSIPLTRASSRVNSAAHRGPLAAWRITARAACPMSSKLRRGCPTGHRSRRCIT